MSVMVMVKVWSWWWGHRTADISHTRAHPGLYPGGDAAPSYPRLLADAAWRPSQDAYRPAGRLPRCDTGPGADIDDRSGLSLDRGGVSLAPSLVSSVDPSVGLEQPTKSSSRRGLSSLTQRWWAGTMDRTRLVVTTTPATVARRAGVAQVADEPRPLIPCDHQLLAPLDKHHTLTTEQIAAVAFPRPGQDRRRLCLSHQRGVLDRSGTPSGLGRSHGRGR
jgi:hypothetical protein